MKKKPLKPKNEKSLRTVYRKRQQSLEALKLHYKFWVLIGTLVLAAVCIFIRLDTPGVWAFLSVSGGWAAFTSK
jgi:hypothetical protein